MVAQLNIVGDHTVVFKKVFSAHLVIIFVVELGQLKVWDINIASKEQ